jgi:threonylcarbamoyladenosine tRNA methylthiotransferase MtaB
MRCYFYTFGCKVNTCETAGMQALLAQNGFPTESDPERAEIAVINSCTVTASGDHRVRSLLRQLRKKNPDLILVLTGCYAQAFPEEAAAIEEADLIVGTKNRDKLPQLLHQYLSSGRQRLCAIAPYSATDTFTTLHCDQFSHNTRAFLKIQDGCNCFCSYCIIPYARGRCRSMPPETLRVEVQHLAAQGHREIVLCGINLAFYGMEWDGSLLDAIRICTAAPDIQRIRLGSLEPERITESLLQALSTIPQFCPQFHLSLQSGCDRTLHAMNRRYTAAEYAALCRLVRRYFPQCAITTDIMVGFPGETDADFRQSLTFAQQMQFARMHVFRYSPRAGTPAARRTDPVPEHVKTERMHQMQAAAAHMQKTYLRHCIGRTVPVLFERERGDGFHVGHTPDGTVVKVPEKNTKKSLRKSIFCVKIEESDAACCYGTLTESGSAASTWNTCKE